MFKLITSLAKLSIGGLESKIITYRSLSLTSELNRKHDSRAHPPYRLPSSKNKRWIEMKPMKELYEYTVDPLPFPSSGGRGPNGRIWNHNRGGGAKKMFFMIDDIRANRSLMSPTEDTLTEKIIEIKSDQNRSAFIAMVASGEHKRYIIAGENMKVGDILVSTDKLSNTPIRPVEGYSYPLGSLPLGTQVSCVERTPGLGADVAKAAGTFATVVRKHLIEDGPDMVVLKMPSKKELILSKECQATVGKVSNVLWEKEHWGKAGAKRLAGIRPRSGLWHRKTGRFGRKIKPPRAAELYKQKDVTSTKYFTYSGNPGLRERVNF